MNIAPLLFIGGAIFFQMMEKNKKVYKLLLYFFLFCSKIYWIK